MPPTVEEIRDALHLIHKGILQSQVNTLGVYTGIEGIALFRVLYARYSGEDLSDQLSALIGHFLEESYQNTNPTLSYGKAGSNFFFAYLTKLGLLDFSNDVPYFSDDEELMTESLALFRIGNMDFLHGGLGIAYQFLFRYEPAFEEYFNKLFDLLLSGMKDTMFCSFDVLENRKEEGIVNLGFAHGIPSLLKFALDCYKAAVCREQARTLMHYLTTYLTSFPVKENAGWRYPNRTGDRQQEKSRLGWCYGDLGIGYCLYLAGRELQDAAVERFGLDVLLYTSRRTTAEETMIYDAGLCHGSAGVAYILLKLYKMSGMPEFRDRADYWIVHTLAFGRSDRDALYYERSGRKDKEVIEPEYGLLEGSAGVGLVLYSYLTGDFSWDYCLMLNN